MTSRRHLLRAAAALPLPLAAQNVPDRGPALGGASHMGRRDIATFLIGQGARMDLFAAAMLGKLEIVNAALAAFPAARLSLGPHKIPLLAHARKGGEEAVAVVQFLESLQAA